MTNIPSSKFNLTLGELMAAGRTVERNTRTDYVVGGIGVHAKPVLDDILNMHGITPNDESRSWLITHAAEHSAILKFLNPTGDPSFSLDACIDAAMKAAEAIPGRTGVSDQAVKAIMVLSDVMRERGHELARYPHWDALSRENAGLAEQILAVAAARQGLTPDDFSTFQLQAAFARSRTS